jgi:large subunit ribosomal protein L25
MSTQQIPQIQVQPRAELGTRHTARLREKGRMPAVIYGHKQDPVHVSADAKQVLDLLHLKAHVLEVVLEDSTEPCLVKAVQWDHMGDEILHIDLARVDLSETVSVDVDIELHGDAVGLKESGTVLDHTLSTVAVRCRVTEIPESIRIDVSELGVNATFTVADLSLPAGVECALPAETVLAAVRVLAIAETEDEVEAVEGAEAEPQVIGRDKADGAAEEDESESSKK